MAKSEDVVGVANTSVGYNFSAEVNENSKRVHQYTAHPIRAVDDLLNMRFTEGEDVSIQTAEQFENAYNFSAQGLPAGLEIDSVSGLISGTVNEGTSDNSPYNVTVTGHDYVQRRASTGFTIDVSAPPAAEGGDESTSG